MDKVLIHTHASKLNLLLPFLFLCLESTIMLAFRAFTSRKKSMRSWSRCNVCVCVCFSPKWAKSMRADNEKLRKNTPRPNVGKWKACAMRDHVSVGGYRNVSTLSHDSWSIVTGSFYARKFCTTTAFLQNFGEVLFTAISVVDGFSEIKKDT